MPLDSIATNENARGALRPTRGDWRARVPFFYGWLIVAAAFISLGISYTVWYSFSVFFVAVMGDFGWSRAASAGVFSLFVIVCGLAGAAAGILSDRFGPGRVASAGAVVLVVGLLACSLMAELWQFYLFYGIIAAVGVSTSGWIPCITMINRWFSARLGAALGIASGGIGVGILVMVPVSEFVIEHFGWRAAYQVLAAIVLVGVAPVALLLLRGRPEDYGLQRDGRGDALTSKPGSAGSGRLQFQVKDQEWVKRPWTVATATRTRRFWFITAMFLLNNVATQMLFVHQVAYLVDGGYGTMLAASIVGLVGLLSVGAKIGWGWLSDRLGRELTWTMGLSCLALSVLLLIGVRLVVFPPMIYLYAVFFALGYGASAPLAPSVVADVFAGRNFGAIYGTAGIANGLGSACGAWLAGFLFDVTGSYVMAFACAAGSSLLSLATVWLVAPGKVRGVPDRSV